MSAQKSGMTMDFTEFNQGLKNADTKTVRAAEKGMFAAMNELMRDARVTPPQAPKEVGDLWGSAQVDKVTVTKGTIEGKCGFNIVYAARWHELSASENEDINWTRDKGAKSPGRKYLERKMATLKDKYMKIVAAFIKKVL